MPFHASAASRRSPDTPIGASAANAGAGSAACVHAVLS
jgi:hypothetical protein